jgi:putative transposase
VIKTLKYRLYPTKRQWGLLQEQLGECRWLYNHFLEERRSLWESERKSVSYFDQAYTLPALKLVRSTLTKVYAQVLQDVANRVDKAFQGFFRRVKRGDKKAGYPRFKGFDRYDSITYKQAGIGWRLLEGKLVLSKIGSIKLKLHRPIVGTMKTCTIRRKSNKWYACFAVDCTSTCLRRSDKAVGIDIGLETFATLSDKKKIENPRFFKKEQKALVKVQRKLEKQEKGSLERRKAKKVLNRVYERTSNRRHNFIHQESRKIVNRYGIICIEKLDIQSMLQNGFRAKHRSISDAAWNQFAHALSYKAEEAGRQFVAVDPRGTSQRCSQCGFVVRKALSERWHKCPTCGLHMHRDLNASLNILALGLQCLGVIPRSSLRKQRE